MLAEDNPLGLTSCKMWDEVLYIQRLLRLFIHKYLYLIYPYNLQPERLLVQGLDYTRYSTRRLHCGTESIIIIIMILDLFCNVPLILDDEFHCRLSCLPCNSWNSTVNRCGKQYCQAIELCIKYYPAAFQKFTLCLYTLDYSIMYAHYDYTVDMQIQL